MALNNKPIVLDIDKRFNRLLLGKSLDTTGARSYTMKILYSNLALNLTGLTVQVGGTKPDGFGVLSNCKVIDSTKGIIELDLTTQMLTTPGILKLEIIFLKGDIRLSSIPFEVEVIKSVTNYNQVVSSNDFLVFQDELKKIRAQMDAAVDKINSRYASTEQKANKLIDAMQHTVDGTIANEVYNNTYETIEGTNIKCNTKFAGYTKDFIIEGRTLQNLDCTNNCSMNIGTYNTFLTNNVSMYKPNTLYTVIVIIEDNKLMSGEVFFNGYDSNKSTVFKSATNLSITPISRGILSNVYRTKSDLSDCIRTGFFTHSPETAKGSLVYSVIILEGDWTNKEIPPYFDGFKSVGDLNNNKVNINSIDRDINLVWRGNLLMYKPKIEGDYIVSPKTINYYGLMINITDIPVGKEIKINSPGVFNRVTTFSKQFINDDALDESSKIRSIYEINTGTNNISFVKSSNENYLFIGCYDLMKMNRQIEFNILDFDKKEISLPIEDGLKSLPNGVCDRIYEKDNEIILEQNVGKIRLNGSRTWTKYLHQSNGYFCAVMILPDIKESRNSLICDRFINQSVWQPTSALEGIEATKTNNQNALFIKIENSKLTSQDINGFKKWLQDNPTTVYYQLSEPIYHKIKGFKTLNLKLYNQESYIQSENKIKPIIKFGYSSTLRSSVDNNAESIFNINEIIKNLGPEDIGAVSRKGDTVTGTLKFNSIGNEIEIQTPSEKDQARGVVYKNISGSGIIGMIGALMNKDKVTKTFIGATSSPWNGINSLIVDISGAYFDNKRLLSTNDLSNGKGQGIPIIGADSVMEVGSMIDFHANSSVKDYSVRVEVDSNSLFKLQGCNGLIVNNKKVQLEPDTTPLWQGCYYMSTGQNITLSKSIDDCQNGIILVWGDFDAPSTQTNCNYTTFIIPKNAGINNSGNYLCSIPYSENVGWIIKAVSIKGNTILGNSNDNQTGWNDVVLYKVLEY